MGFLDRLLGRETRTPNLPALLKATIWANDLHRYWIVFHRIHPQCQDLEYVRLASHYYAKVLYNFGSEQDEMGSSARLCVSFMETLLAHEVDRSSNVMQLAGIDVAAVVPNPGRPGQWKAEAVLYLVNDLQRHLTTTFPQSGSAQDVVFSVFALIQTALRALSDPKECEVLIAALRNMQLAYRNDASWADADALALIPARAYFEAIPTGQGGA